MNVNLIFVFLLHLHVDIHYCRGISPERNFSISGIGSVQTAEMQISWNAPFEQNNFEKRGHSNTNRGVFQGQIVLCCLYESDLPTECIKCRTTIDTTKTIENVVVFYLQI